MGLYDGFRYSHSITDQYLRCPFSCHIQYMLGYESLLAPEPNNALIVGHALHTGIEKDVESAIEEYKSHYPMLKDLHYEEIMKFTNGINKSKELLAWKYPGCSFEHEKEIIFEEENISIHIDLIVDKGDGTVDIVDYKYTSNIDNYLSSKQLSIYKWALERIGYKVDKCYFLHVPKINIRRSTTNKKHSATEDTELFRLRLRKSIESSEVTLHEFTPKASHIELFKTTICLIETDCKFEPTPNKFCSWCNLYKFCTKGESWFMLPKNERRKIKESKLPDIWLYAESYAGKTQFADQFDNNLMLNTDGNIDYITSPVLRITDTLTNTNTREPKRVLAWQNFLDTITELEKKQNDFEIITLDLVEDLYEHCRLYMYDQLKIKHEQEAGFGKGWDMVTTEFLSTIKRLKNAGYRLIFISKMIKNEETNSAGGKVTKYAPNLRDKIANVLAGVVDATCYIDIKRSREAGEVRELVFDKSDMYFSGGRIPHMKNGRIPLTKEAFVDNFKVEVK